MFTKRRECNRCSISIVLVCSSIFIVGVILLILGVIRYRSEPPPPPYFWSLTVCPGTNKQTWVGAPVTVNGACLDPVNLPKEGGIPQIFDIPKNILGEGIPYEPVFYVTNNVYGNITISHHVGGYTISTYSSNLKNLVREDFAYAGGKSLQIYRNGPLREEEGDYVTETCQDIKTGCEYEPARSLNSYSFLEAKIHMPNIPEEGSSVKISVSLEASKSSSIIYPEVYLEYKISGRGPEQDVGLALMIIGAIFADLMPATLFFLLQKYHFERKGEDDTKGMIPLMELQ